MGRIRFATVVVTVPLPSAAGSFDAAATGPPLATSGRCAGAWNHTGPAGVKAQVAQRHTRQATATATRTAHATFSWTEGGKVTSTKTSGDGCVISFFLPTRTVTLFGAWDQGTVVSWSGPRYGQALSGSGNACVARDGTIHQVGRFTASSRCP